MQLLIIVMSIIYLGTCIFSQTAQLFTWMHAMAIATHIVILSACICTLEVLRGQWMKLIQTVSKSEFQEY